MVDSHPLLQSSADRCVPQCPSIGADEILELYWIPWKEEVQLGEIFQVGEDTVELGGDPWSLEPAVPFPAESLLDCTVASCGKACWESC